MTHPCILKKHSCLTIRDSNKLRFMNVCVCRSKIGEFENQFSAMEESLENLDEQKLDCGVSESMRKVIDLVSFARTENNL